MKKIVNGEEIFALFEDSFIRTEKILSHGNASPENFWYCQNEGEWVSLIEGKAELEFSEGKKILCKGENMYIPPYLKHRVSWVSDDAVWYCVFIKKQ